MPPLAGAPGAAGSGHGLMYSGQRCDWGKVKGIVSKEKSSNQILDLGYKDEAGGSKSL